VAITEQSRHQLYKHLEELMGADDAATLMGHLPPVGWADVATRRDLDAMEQRLRLEWRADLANGLRLQALALLGGFSVIATILTLVGR
jgi:hypothetical protein